MLNRGLRRLVWPLLIGLVVLCAGSGCVSCHGGNPGTDSGIMGADSGTPLTDSGMTGCTSFDECGEGFMCAMGACVPCPASGCPSFTSIPLPTTGVVFWTFASAGSLGSPLTSATHTLVGVVGQGCPLPSGADFAQDGPSHTNYAGFAASLVAP